MKAIFLDIDGVLNCQTTKDYCGLWLGIDDDKIKRLHQIADTTSAQIVLTSTWKYDWYRVEKEKQDDLANYLDRKLAAEGLEILDKTEDLWSDRGAGILRWVKAHQVESFVILDDEPFDYAEQNLLNRVIGTIEGNDNGGLQDEHVEKAIKILNKNKEEE